MIKKIVTNYEIHLESNLVLTNFDKNSDPINYFGDKNINLPLDSSLVDTYYEITEEEHFALLEEQSKQRIRSPRLHDDEIDSSINE